MNKPLTTAEQAAAGTPLTRGLHSSSEMLRSIACILKDRPDLAHYLSHPEIIIGLAEGRFGPNGLTRRLSQMADADDCES